MLQNTNEGNWFCTFLTMLLKHAQFPKHIEIKYPFHLKVYYHVLDIFHTNCLSSFKITVVYGRYSAIINWNGLPSCHKNVLFHKQTERDVNYFFLKWL